MGSHRLRPLYPFKFSLWVKRAGYRDEMDFWSSLSGLAHGTITDHMTSYLSSLGYNGTPRDMLCHFLRDQIQTGRGATIFDMANQLFDGTYGAAAPSASAILTEDGDILTTEGGDHLVIE